MNRLVVVSNRVAASGRKQAVQGGLAVALVAALEKSGGVWFGWNGKVTRYPGKQPSLQREGNITFATLPLSKRGYNEYYMGYANSSLWPLFHMQLQAFQYDRLWREGYQRVNRHFARKLLPLLEGDEIIWVHDYHLIPLADELRKAGVDQPIGFFLHIPFPPFEILRALPDHEFILRTLCEYDLLGFQTEADEHAFINGVTKVCRDARVGKNSLTAWGRNVRTESFPIGIQVDEVVAMAERGRRSTQTKRLQSRLLNNRDLIIGVERLDYSKGLPERFRAFRRLLERYPGNRGNVEYLQIAAPSRTDVPQYREIQQELNQLAGQINSKYAEYDWIPLHYLNRAFARATIMGFLSISRVGLVTPLRDGMNLVAKEFAAAQDPQDPGVLVLSGLAGAAHELTDALIVNPYDIDEVAEALSTALAMPLKERSQRWHGMMEVLKKNDVFHWADTFLECLGGRDGRAS
ncbi:MAG: trehalose-6-phosphate synthase [Gammaproteobacteria bacterium]